MRTRVQLQDYSHVMVVGRSHSIGWHIHILPSLMRWSGCNTDDNYDIDYECLPVLGHSSRGLLCIMNMLAHYFDCSHTVGIACFLGLISVLVLSRGRCTSMVVLLIVHM